MSIDALEVRIARLEGGFEQINVRLGAIEHRMGAMEQRFSTEIGSLRAQMSGMATRSELADLRRQMNAQFFWLLTFVLGSILIPILRDFAR
jgi:hypothetical protein